MDSTATSTTDIPESREARQTLHSVSSRAHAAVDSLTGVADDAVRRAGPAIGRASAMAHRAVDRAADAAQPSADWLAAQYECMNAAQQKIVRDACSYISANPVKSVGFAFAAGFLIARIARR